MSSAIRVGAVSYLNAKPLYYRLCDFAPEIELSDGRAQPAGRAAGRRGARRGADPVGRVPSRHADLGYEIIPGFAIAARGPVRSVKLFSRVPLERIERLALDEGSRTSQVLARVWLDASHGVRPAIDRVAAAGSARCWRARPTRCW